MVTSLKLQSHWIAPLPTAWKTSPHWPVKRKQWTNWCAHHTDCVPYLFCFVNIFVLDLWFFNHWPKVSGKSSLKVYRKYLFGYINRTAEKVVCIPGRNVPMEICHLFLSNQSLIPVSALLVGLFFCKCHVILLTFAQTVDQKLCQYMVNGKQPWCLLYWNILVVVCHY